MGAPACKEPKFLLFDKIVPVRRPNPTAEGPSCGVSALPPPPSDLYPALTFPFPSPFPLLLPLFAFPFPSPSSPLLPLLAGWERVVFEAIQQVLPMEPARFAAAQACLKVCAVRLLL